MSFPSRTFQPPAEHRSILEYWTDRLDSSLASYPTVAEKLKWLDYAAGSTRQMYANLANDAVGINWSHPVLGAPVATDFVLFLSLIDRRRSALQPKEAAYA